MVHLDNLAPPTPQLPQRRFGVLVQLAAAAALHLTGLTIAAMVRVTPATATAVSRAQPISAQNDVDVRRIVFLAPDLARIGGGGGGGGNQQPGPIRRAQGVGRDAITLRARTSPPVTPVPSDSPAFVGDDPPLPSLLLDARPLASGTSDQIGLPTEAYRQARQLVLDPVGVLAPASAPGLARAVVQVSVRVPAAELAAASTDLAAR